MAHEHPLAIKFTRQRLYMKALGPGYLAAKLVSPGVHKAHTKYGPLYYRRSDSDLMTFWHVLGEAEYDLAPFPRHAAKVAAAYDRALRAGKTPVIIDAGANVGAASIWFSTAFPQARILAVEPDPMNARLCRLNTEGRNVEVVEAAIGAKAGSVTLVEADASWGVQTVRGGGVPVVTVPSLVKRVSGGELLLAKIDIEGFESDLFAENTGWIDRAAAVIIEPHDWLLPGGGTSGGFRQVLGPDFDMLISGENLVFVRWNDLAVAAPNRVAAAVV